MYGERISNFCIGVLLPFPPPPTCHINLLTQICHFGSSVVTVIAIAHLSMGVNFSAFIRMTRINASFIRLTCNLGYFFEILFSSHLCCWGRGLWAPAWKHFVHLSYILMALSLSLVFFLFNPKFIINLLIKS